MRVSRWSNGRSAAMTTENFVRTQMEPSQQPPASSSGIGAWMRKNLFATWSDSILTIVAMLFLFWITPGLYNFLIGKAVFPGGTVEDCRALGAGACWAYIHDRFDFFIYGFYPKAETWRVNIVFVMLT